MKRDRLFTDASVAAAPAALRADTVDLWRVDLDCADAHTVAQLRGTLSSDEDARAQRFRFERDRRRFVVARGVVRTLLAAYVGCRPEELVFRYGTNGKPHLAYPTEQVHFNVTHSEGLALIAFTRGGPVGIDVERIRDLPDWEAIALTCMPPAALEAARRLPALTRQIEFFRAWTRQEARLKATGAGLGGIADEVEPGDLLSAFRLHAIEVGTDFAATLAAPTAIERANCFVWAPHRPVSGSEFLTFKLDDLDQSRVELL